MFDDVANMAQEALADMPQSSIKQVHLYNLNGIYVPASMILSYVSETVQGASKFLAQGTAAQASIIVPSINANYTRWKEGSWTRNKIDYTSDGPQLRPEHWQAVAAEAAGGTKVKITFLATFKDFISRLGKL